METLDQLGLFPGQVAFLPDVVGQIEELQLRLPRAEQQFPVALPDGAVLAALPEQDFVRRASFFTGQVRQQVHAVELGPGRHECAAAAQNVG